jgi:hypothetical protein
MGFHPILATKAFFSVLFGDGEAATEAAPPPPPTAFQESKEPAIQLLALLQKEGRLVDFLMEDVASYSDADIGAAVRAVHAGCRKVVTERVVLARILPGEEGAMADVPAGFDASTISVIGATPPQGAFRATLNHQGWLASEVKLPTVASGANPRVVAPAEVQL